MSVADLKIRFRGDNRNLITSLKRGEKGVKRFSKNIIASARKAGTALNHLGQGYLGMTALFGGGAAVAMAGKSVIDFDSRLARLAIQAGLSKAEMFQLKKELYETADAANQRPERLLDGIEKIVEKTGNFKFAIASLKDMGIVATATGAAMADIGATSSNLQQKMGIRPDQLLMVFDFLTAQGKEGSFELKNMAAYFEELLSAAQRFDVSGVRGMRSFGAFLQMARSGAAGPAEAATSVARVIDDLIANWKQVHDVTDGFMIWDEEKSKKAGIHVAQDLDLVLKEIIRRTKGDVVKLQKIFDIRSMKAITPLASSFKKFGDFREFDHLVEVGGDGKMIMKDFAFWTEQTASKITDLATNLSRFANENLAGPIEALTAALDFLNRHPLLAQGGLWAALGLGAVLAGIQVGSMFKGGGGHMGHGGGAVSGGLASATGVTPVFVVNKQMSMIPGKGWKFAAGAGGAASAAGTAGVGIGTKIAKGFKAAAMVKYGLWTASIPLLAGGLAIAALLNAKKDVETSNKNIKENNDSNRQSVLAGINSRLDTQFKTIEEAYGKLHAINMETANRNVENKIGITVNIDKDGHQQVVAEGNQNLTLLPRGAF